MSVPAEGLVEMPADALDPGWFCVQTKPNREETTAAGLRGKRVNVFAPRITEPTPRGGPARPRPLFPSYIFARLDSAHDYYAVKWTPGVRRIVSDARGPLPVADEVIDAIADGMERDTYVEATRLTPGARVAVRGGVFEGLVGIFQSYASGHTRVRILLGLLQRQVVADLDWSLIEKV